MVDNIKLFALNIGTALYNNETHTINWQKVLEAFGFEDLIYNNPRLIRSQTFGDDDYEDNIIQIIQDSLNENINDSIFMINYLFREYTNFSEDQISDLINTNSLDLKFLNNIHFSESSNNIKEKKI